MTWQATRRRQPGASAVAARVFGPFGLVGHLLGYARVSTAEPNTDLQTDELTAAGCWRQASQGPLTPAAVRALEA